MARLTLTALSTLVCGLAGWAVFGAIFAEIFSRMPGGAREGGGAMAGFFYAGPLCGLICACAGGWMAWRALAQPERAGSVALTLVLIVAAVGIGAYLVSRPPFGSLNDYPGQQAALHLEVGFPPNFMPPARDLSFEFRSADGTEPFPALVQQKRTEDGRIIVPALFRVRTTPRSKLLAIMHGEHQFACATLTVDDNLTATTAWSDWEYLENGYRARWRFTVSPAP